MANLLTSRASKNNSTRQNVTKDLAILTDFTYNDKTSDQG